jgi:hypothetical protein
MKPIIILSFFSVFLVTFFSCNKDFLNKTPDGDLTLKQIFENPVFAEQYLTNVYSHLPQELRMVDNPSNGGVPNNPFTGASDEMEMCYEPNFANNMNAGTWNPTSYTQDIWPQCYMAIRKANIFLENISTLPVSELAPASIIERWKGEAIFLKALYHFYLIRVYGPVPIMDKSVTLDFDYLSIRRDPIDKCVAYIVDECDKAATLLDDKITAQNDFGRPSKATALALKARVLLYMASPLWNGNPDYVSFKDKEGVRLFPDFQASRWQTAANAAKACIDQAEAAGYKLYKSASGDPVKNYQEIFYVNFNDEVFFTVNDPTYNNIDAYSEPRGMAGAFWPLQAPTQDLVDDYEMANGMSPILGYNADLTPIINPVSSYDEKGQAVEATANYFAGTRNMYVNRDPRFYASINFTGAKYKQTPPQNRTTPLQFWKGGLDGRTNNSADNYSETGYMLKKLTHPSFVMSPKADPIRTWVAFRLGEQYLNYAEALNEAQGPVSDVYKYVNLIRDRVGMPGLAAGLTKEKMRESIQHERRIELAFETHRYFDCLRWKIAENVFNKDIIGLNVNTTGFSISSDGFYVRTKVETRVFEKKHYLWPIPQKELDKNHSLVQNPGW